MKREGPTDKKMLQYLEKRKEDMLEHEQVLRESLSKAAKRHVQAKERIEVADIQMETYKTRGLVVTEHAINRFREKIATKRQGRIKRAIETIIHTVEKGVELHPINNVNRIIKNEFKEARYLVLGETVAVVEGALIKTVYKYDKNCKRNFKPTRVDA